MSTELLPRIEETTGSGLGDSVRVIVLDDDHNTFEGVAMALMQVLPNVTPERGVKYAIEIHTTGSATVWTGHRELAELYHEQLTACGLTMAPLES